MSHILPQCKHKNRCKCCNARYCDTCPCRCAFKSEWLEINKWFCTGLVCNKENQSLFVGQVEENTFNVKFIYRHGYTWKFPFPDKNDISEAERDGIILELSQSSVSGGNSSLLD